VVLRIANEALRFLRREVQISENLYQSTVYAAKCQEQELQEARVELDEAERALQNIYDQSESDADSTRKPDS